ncbi:hypothetical protein M0812_28708 [Anaeramoeba flamelloides]|uniref:Uncharacterized protein n=1 Tax=Anaeramoeba flamelloides TaxID=1746091 RepID=A0AAV7Y8V6_9EUKA|nr:hypothetical protein M0812_28708 [Anaeramoeba flamelloides]
MGCVPSKSEERPKQEFRERKNDSSQIKKKTNEEHTSTPKRNIQYSSSKEIQKLKQNNKNSNFGKSYTDRRFAEEDLAEAILFNARQSLVDLHYSPSNYGIEKDNEKDLLDSDSFDENGLINEYSLFDFPKNKNTKKENLVEIFNQPTLSQKEKQFLGNVGTEMLDTINKIKVKNINNLVLTFEIDDSSEELMLNKNKSKKK